MCVHFESPKKNELTEGLTLAVFEGKGERDRKSNDGMSKSTIGA